MEISCSGEPKKCPASSHRLGAPGGSLAGCRAAAAAAADAFTFLSGRTHAHSERTPRPGFPVAPLPAGCRLPVNMRGSQKGATAIGGAEPGLPSAKLWSCQLLVQCELDFGATAGSEAFVP